MIEHMRPFMNCQGCGTSILLPSFTPQGRQFFRTWWPSEKWQRTFLCLQCKAVCVYSGQDVHWQNVPARPEESASETPSAKAFELLNIAYVEIPCATPECKAKVTIHASVDLWPPNRALIAALDAADFREAACSEGHAARHQNGLRLQVDLDRNWWTAK